MIAIFDIDNWKEVTATLSRNKTRTFLTAFGIFWGTAMLALLWSGGQGLRRLIYSNFDGFASNSAILFPQPTTMPYHGYQKGMSWTLNLNDVANMRRAVPGLATVSPISSMRSDAVYRDKSYSVTVQGVEPNFMNVLNPLVRSGRFINEADISNAEKVCVLGKDVADRLFGDVPALGKFVEIDKVFYRVAGVVKQQSEISFNGRIDESVLIPLTTAQRTYNTGNTIHFVSLIAKPGYTPTQLRPDILRVLRMSHPLHPQDDDCYFFMDISEQFQMVDNIFTGVDVLLLFVGFSSLIAGVIGVGNIMWIVVKERTREFGIRRAIGARPREVLWQILSEGAVLTSVAGMAGICFAALVLGAVTPLIGQSASLPADFQMSFADAVVIMALFLTLGTAAGAIPAFKAMSIKPVDALNDK